MTLKRVFVLSIIEKVKLNGPGNEEKNGAFNFVPRVFLHVKFKMADSLVSFLCMRYNMAFRGADQKERGH